MKRLLVAIDFSEGSAASLDEAIALGQSLGATLELAFVHSLPTYLMPPPIEILPVLADPAILDRAQKGLDEAGAKVKAAGLECTTVILSGVPFQEIVRHAEETKADLVVMGTHGRTGLSHVLLGSVAERVIQRARCPVLVVPTHGSKPPKPL